MPYGFSATKIIRFRLFRKPLLIVVVSIQRIMPYFWLSQGLFYAINNDGMTLRARIGLLVAFFFRSLLWSLNLWLVFYTCLAYWLLYRQPTQHWLAGLIMITIPVAWVLNLIVMIMWLTARPWRSWLSGLVLIVGLFLFGSRTFSWHQAKPLSGGGIPLKVFSYNVKTFDLDLETFGKYPSSPRFRRTANYVLRVDAPIKCFQEFYTSTISPQYDFFERFQKAGYPHSCILHPVNRQSSGGAFGMAIFSKYPILSWGKLSFEPPNGLLWADIKVGNDTIRVINVHLHSMGIRLGKVFRTDKIDKVKRETKGILSALRTGFVERNIQVVQLQQHIKESPYPVIVTGDFNDTPYSTVYERMRAILPNSFEQAGHGFGFTYNRLPNFIRIDNQFHDPRIPVLDFETINYVRDSDHYPILGTYQLK